MHGQPERVIALLLTSLAVPVTLSFSTVSAAGAAVGEPDHIFRDVGAFQPWWSVSPDAIPFQIDVARLGAPRSSATRALSAGYQSLFSRNRSLQTGDAPSMSLIQVRQDSLSASSYVSR